MKLTIITLLIFLGIYLVSFYNKPTENFSFFDRTHTRYIKGLAIFLVILSHMGGQFGIRYLTPLGGTGVAMFLICSGYGLEESYKKKGLTNYWRNKILKVWFPYFLIQTIVSIILVIFFSVDFSLPEYLSDLLLINYRHPLGWYLQFAFFWYFIFYIISRVPFLTNDNRIKILGFISFGLIFVPNQLWAEQALSVFTGFCISHNKDIFSIKDKRSVSLSLLFIGLFFLAIKQISLIRYLPWVLTNVNQLLVKLPLALGMCFLIYQKHVLFKNNLFVYFGNFSFSLYLLHGYTMDILSPPSFFNIIIFLAITYVLSILFNILVTLIYSLNESNKRDLI